MEDERRAADVGHVLTPPGGTALTASEGESPRSLRSAGGEQSAPSVSPRAETPAVDQPLFTRLPFFYGWIIVGVVSLVRILKALGQNNTLFLYIPAMLRELGYTRSQLSGFWAVACCTAALGLPYFGRLCDRYSGRIILPVSMLLFSGAVVLLSATVDTGTQPLSAVEFFVALVTVRGFALGAIDTCIAAFVSRWFERLRARVFAVISMVAALGTVGLVQALAFLLRHFGWRRSEELSVLPIVLLCVPLCALCLRDRPDMCGLLPDGAAAPPPPRAQALAKVMSQHSLAGKLAGEEARAEDQEKEKDEGENFTLEETLRTGAFWVLMLNMLATFMIASGTDLHLTSILHEASHGTVTPEDTISITTGVTAFLLPLPVGWIVDHGIVSTKTMFVIATLFAALFSLTLPFVSADSLAYILGMFWGCFGGIYGVVCTSIWPKYFGTAHIGKIMGCNRVSITVGSGVGPLFIAVVSEVCGTFKVPLWILGVISMAFSLVLAMTPAPSKSRGKSCYDSADVHNGMKKEASLEMKSLIGGNDGTDDEHEV